MYALVENNEIVKMWDTAPEGYNLIGFPPNCPDEVYAQYNIFPVTYINTPIQDAYHTNNLIYSVVNGLPIGTWIINEVSDELWTLALVNAVQIILDSKAQERNYDNIFTAATYASDTNMKYKTEAIALIQWRGQVWDKCYEVLGAVQQGLRTKPTEAELIAELPIFNWPVV